MEVEAWQPLGERDPSVHSVSNPECTSQKAQIFGNNLTISVGLFMPCSKATFYPDFLQISQRCEETLPGPWGWWAVRGGPW